MPAPPHFSGMATASRPSSPSFSTASAGKRVLLVPAPRVGLELLVGEGAAGVGELRLGSR